jgi:hypothetical protein
MANLPVDDAALVSTSPSTHATIGRWTQLMPAAIGRMGSAVQNKSAGSIFVVRADAQPADGSVAGEIEIPAEPGYYPFDWVPKGAYWVRGSAASQALTLWTW